jgi:MoaA/NifB/PqqE/SkfB family radical SAM enzyme
MRENELVNEYLASKNEHIGLCMAPFVSMSIGIDGSVGPCCYTQFSTNKEELIEFTDLSSIWVGNRYSSFRESIEERLLPTECKICFENIISKQFATVKSNSYDKYSVFKEAPSIIELAIDNTCNLECVMCNSNYSSKISHSENIKSDIKINLDNLYLQIKEFLAYLEEIIFSGGEPLISNFYNKIWLEIIEANPKCKISINTNATLITPRLKEVFETGNFSFNISLDSINKSTYESIRRNANFETVMSNFYYLKDYSIRNNRSLSVVVCPLIQNCFEIPEILHFCNAHDANLVFVYVFNANDVSLSTAPEELLDEVLSYYKSIERTKKTTIEIQNTRMFESLICDVEKWKLKASLKSRIIKDLESDLSDNSTYSTAFLDNTIFNINELLVSDEEKGNLIVKITSLIENAPTHLKSKIFMERLLSYPPNQVIRELQTKSTKHLLNVLETIFDNYCLNCE